MRPEVLAAAIVQTVKAAAGPLEAEIAALRDRLQQLEALPPPARGEPGAPGAPGEPGAPGACGLGFEDLTVAYDGHRTITFALERGAQRQAWPIVLPIPINRGVFKAGKAYEVGDEVTYHGSLWRCDVDTEASPPGNGWRLIVKQKTREPEPTHGG